MDILKILRDGIEGIADTYTDPREHHYPKKDGFLRDNEKLRNDVRRVGTDMKYIIKYYGEQSYEPPSSEQRRPSVVSKSYIHR